jgi:integrase
MTMARRATKITKRTVDGISPNGSDFYVFDSELIGFGVRVRKSGAMSYIARYRAGSGKNAPVRRVTIAKVGKVTPDEARNAAKDILASVVKGEDPARERADARAAATFASLAEDFLIHIEARRKPNTLAQYRHMLNAYAVPALGSRKAASVEPSDVAALHLSLRGKGTTANRVRDVVSSMYGWAIKGKILPKMENPAGGIEKFRETRRERYLLVEEMHRLGAAIREAETAGIPWEPDPKKKAKHAPKPQNRLVKIDPAVAAALRLFILTGARLREILHLTWDMVDLERGLLLLPDSKTGQKAIVLNAPAQMILSELPRIGRYVIPGRDRTLPNGSTESRPRSDLKRPWSLVRKRAGLEATAENPALRVRIHDLRHTHASIGVGASLGLPIIGKLLGHTQARTTERYAHLEADPLRKASDAIGRRIAAAMGDEAGEDTAARNVIPMKPA